jgi:hypothetical protein
MFGQDEVEEIPQRRLAAIGITGALVFGHGIGDQGHLHGVLMSSVYLETGLSTEALHFHRALASLQEELEAIDLYHQRADVTSDLELKAILIHNRNDEMEHAAMLLEWLRRTEPAFELQLRKMLFRSGDIPALGLPRLRPRTARGLVWAT